MKRPTKKEIYGDSFIFTLNYQRVITVREEVGVDCNGVPTQQITIITDGGGKIITAFPGRMDNLKAQQACGSVVSQQSEYFLVWK